MNEPSGAGMQLQGLDQLLATKLHIHASSQSLVPRPRLLERLNEVMERKLILLSAPAGFGKTTLLCEWLRSPAGKDHSHKPTAPLDWLKALTKHALQPDQRVRMEMEARTGVYKVERAKAQSEQDLKLLLANPTTLPISQGTPVFGNGTSTMTTTPWVDSRPRTRSRIEREAFRNPVGEQVTNAVKCSFSGVLPIELKQFLNSGISLKECPYCARMRSLSPRSGVLRFPSHDQRKRRTPTIEQRWAGEKTIWGVVGGESR